MEQKKELCSNCVYNFGWRIYLCPHDIMRAFFSMKRCKYHKEPLKCIEYKEEDKKEF